MNRPAERAFVALGANLGDRAGNIAAALDRLRGIEGIRVIRVSHLLQNPAVGGPPDSPAFLNGVAEIETTLSPRELLMRLLDVEHDLGRERHAKWAPRNIDLDLILYGNEVVDEQDLKVPHPRMHERRFVLQPLAQLAPDAVHPILRRTASELLYDLDPKR
ncbi:MAG TPA: 2-amino-4-hydroxy-6-hydroxymethyldihydropteridine diphosphokinase [Tepidisphaeraceae bacterium]|jgi:2-amino-4-hydroxy-6-hydroxymethyldihydropteridine diphosphokinase|nr:2-amino-4-hydroxy-6-hydroxymethyldihydropteridine diphosphokinase [Tepidisphaeraceae bacterium]